MHHESSSRFESSRKPNELKDGINRSFRGHSKLAQTNETRLTNLLKEHYALFGVLLGAALVSISLGPYSNWDSQTEYTAASSVIVYGVPFATYGNLINQPPIGFYINALFLRVFGLSYSTGVSAVTLFGVGCVFLVYEVGKTIYGTRTGLVAAALFALTPWHVVLSRSFLIDAQSLFFSLLSLLVGIWAVRKASLKLTLASGILFGTALLTKLFAVFTLIPLALIFAYYRPKSLKRVLGGIMIFVLPAFVMYYSWYEVISRLGFFSIFTHTDFLRLNQGGIPSPFFLIEFFIENIGLLFLLAIGVSVALSFWKRKYLSKTVFFDVVCLATVIGTAGVNMYLVLARGLWVPYVDPVKYDYLLLPAFCWLAASLVPKAYSFANHASAEVKRRKLFLAVTLVGLGLLVGAVLVNMRTLQTLTAQEYLLFRVGGDVGYSFVKLAPTIGQQYLAPVQGLGFVLIVVSLLWASKDKLSVSQAFKFPEGKKEEKFC
jgi:4-amino-4-deoxy-L-arabinose transferase-like glycosyltransferase